MDFQKKLESTECGFLHTIFSHTIFSLRSIIQRLNVGRTQNCVCQNICTFRVRRSSHSAAHRHSNTHTMSGAKNMRRKIFAHWNREWNKLRWALRWRHICVRCFSFQLMVRPLNARIYFSHSLGWRLMFVIAVQRWKWNYVIALLPKNLSKIYGYASLFRTMDVQKTNKLLFNFKLSEERNACSATFSWSCRMLAALASEKKNIRARNFSCERWVVESRAFEMRTASTSMYYFEMVHGEEKNDCGGK